MTKQAQEKIARFLADEVMAESVHQVLLGVFIRRQPRPDVQTLAAARIAIDLLEDAWKELQNSKAVREKSNNDSPNIGL